MTPETWAIIGVGIPIVGLFWKLISRIDTRLSDIDSRLHDHGERLMRAETLLKTYSEMVLDIFKK